MSFFSLAAAVGAGALPGEALPAGRLIAAAGFAVPADWAPPPVQGRPFWICAPPPARYSNELAKLFRDDPSLRRLFEDGARTHYVRTLVEEERRAFNRLLIREIELYGPGGGSNLAHGAALSGAADGAVLHFLERVRDGDFTPQSACYSAPARHGIDQPGWITFDFGRDIRIARAVIHGGRPRTEGAAAYDHLPVRFVLQARDAGGAWRDIPGGAAASNLKPRCDLAFEPVAAPAVRLRVDSQTEPLAVSAAKLRDLDIDPGRPFIVSDGESRPPFRCFEDAAADRDDYARWKAQHPNFLGFYCGTEWDNDFGYLYNTNNLDRIRQRGASEAVLALIRERFWNRANRNEALDSLRAYYQAIRARHFDDADKLIFLTCARAFSHYSLEWGAGAVWIETTCAGYQRHQPQLFFARGAARQYGKPWGWYVALGMVDKAGYVDPGYLGKGGEPDAGISPSLNKRDRYLAYLSGATFFNAECFPGAYCQDADGDGAWELSPHGEVLREWHAFTQAHPGRGTSYAPIAIGLPFPHGQSPIVGGPAFGQFRQERADHMIEAVLRTLVPWARDRDQEHALANSPFGDGFDVILPDPPGGPIPLDKLASYKAVVLAGEFDPDPDLAGRLMEYVRNGGTLVLNVRQAGSRLPPSFLGADRSSECRPVRFPARAPAGTEVIDTADAYNAELVALRGARPLLVDASNQVLACVNDVGRGRVVLTTPDYLLPDNLGNLDMPTYSKWQGRETFPLLSFLFARLVREALPIEVRGDIQYGLNKVPGGWWVYLINNKGVAKAARTPERLDPAQSAAVTLHLRDLDPESVTALRGGAPLAWDRERRTVSVTVGPGDVCIVDIRLNGQAAAQAAPEPAP